MKKWCLLSLILFSCTMHSKEDFEMQAKGQIERLTRELNSIHDLEGLKQREKSLKKKFNQITNLMISYHQFLEKHPEAEGHPCDPLVIEAAHLKDALSAVLQIEGAKQVIIDVEKDSFMKLALMEESLSSEGGHGKKIRKRCL